MTRKSKPRRTCKLCKPEKYVGNAKDRKPVADRRQIQDPVPHPSVARTS
jgi:hypothetical protein